MLGTMSDGLAAVDRRSSSTRDDWHRPDDGIWEIRGPRRHFTHSKVMAWVVFDRAVRIVERFDLDAPLERWKQVRRRDPRTSLRARLRSRASHLHAVLRIPRARRQRAHIFHWSGSCQASDERVTGTIDAVTSSSVGMASCLRYSATETDDGLPGDEGQFLACSFWLVSALGTKRPRREGAPAVRAAAGI